MESTSIQIAVILFLLSVVALLFPLGKLPRSDHDHDEPDYIRPIIPIIGHLIGLLHRKYDYYAYLSKKHSRGIFSLAIPGMPGGRVYIITSPQHALAVQKQPKSISFWHVEATFTAGIAGLSPHGAQVILDNAVGEENKPSLLGEGMRSLHADLKSAGKDEPSELATITKAGAQIMETIIRGPQMTHSTRFDLVTWVDEIVRASTMGAIYGPDFPYSQSRFSDAYSDFESNILGLISYPFPKYTASKAYSGREKMVAIFENYFSCDTEASSIVRRRKELSNNYGVSSKDRARFETVFTHAILANTTPTGFWTLFHILSDEAILGEVREAVAPLLTTSEDGKYELDVSQIREVPILKSVFYEALRFYGSGSGTRIVLEDTLLSGRHLLKKDSFIFMPNESYHFETTSWGADANTFDAHRFMKSRPHVSGAFRGFGGGVNLCPGRFLAMSEILTMCTLLVLQFDIMPKSGTWIHPGRNTKNLSLIVNPPERNVLVDVVARMPLTEDSWIMKL